MLYVQANLCFIYLVVYVLPPALLVLVEMDLLMSEFWLLATFVVFTSLDLSASVPTSPQGNQLPYITSNIKQVIGKSYDYIIVGGGTTGCPLAATLSERYSVLVLERGGSPYGNPFVLQRKSFGIPFLQANEFSSVAQRFVSLDGVENHRGRVLGGSTAINSGFYGRTSDETIKKAGWDEKMVNEAYEWVESKVVFAPFLSQWQATVLDGFLQSGILPFNGYTFKHVEGAKVGGTIFDVFGTRHTAADLLWGGNVKNITVLLNVTVKSVIFQPDGSKPRAHGVKFIKSIGKTRRAYSIYLKKPKSTSSWGDVILSSGALGSPQLLMLSGIGPRKHLEKFKIPVVVDLRGVGRKMQDNPAIALLMDSEATPKMPDPPQVAAIIDNYQIIMESATIPTSMNLSRTNIAAKIAFPLSRGKLELNSTDPRLNPLVRFNYLLNEKDMEVCAEMGQLAMRVASTNSVTMFLGTQRRGYVMGANENDTRKYCKKNVRTFYHYHGGCNIGSVVDEDYKVYGVKGLRVLDGSTLMESPGTNPMATLMMLGRYQGIKILQARNNPC